MSNGVSLGLAELVGLRAAARGLELGARRRTLSVQAGGYLSAYRGRGLEFEEVRAYQSGDDARSIDWRVTARRGRPYTKLFREERERPVLLLVDLHPGMHFGTRRQLKSVLAGRMAALLAWAAARAGDRVGGLVSAPDVHREIPPAARDAGVLPLLHALVRLQPGGPGTRVPGRLDMALARMRRVTSPGSLVVVLSDFREMGEAAERHIAALCQHNDVIGGLLYDPLEATPPPAGRYRVGTLGRQWTLDTGQARLAGRWREAFQAHREGVHGLLRRHGAHYMEAATADSPLHALRRGLARSAVKPLREVEAG